MTLLTRVLLVNSAVVAVGAVAGTWLTERVMLSGEVSTRSTLIVFIAATGVVVSLSLNYLMLRAAFGPLAALERVADAVRRGDLSARVERLPANDPQIARLGLVFNQTLEQLAEERAKLQRVASQVITAQEEERKRISRELHDETAQMLFAGLLRMAAYRQSDNPDVRAAAAAMEETTVDALEGVRRIALELRPPALDDLGLIAALQDLAQRYSGQLGIPVEVRARGSRERLAADVELVFYRVAQEALTNAARHARARHIAIDFDRTAEEFTLAVRDDGLGFDPDQRAVAGQGGGLGLYGMAERLSLVGGGLLIWSAPGRGCEIFAWAPARVAAAGARRSVA